MAASVIAAGWIGEWRARRALGRHHGRLRARAKERPKAALAIVIMLVIALLGGVWLWLRDSSLVSVDKVEVTGESGPDAGKIRSALISSARTMTTLDVRMDQLRTVVAPFPVVKNLIVTTQFPHGMRIRVIEQIPVGVVVVRGRRLAVASDGTLLHDVAPSGTLPTIPVSATPGGTQVSEGQARDAVSVLGAAPWQMLAKISQVTTVHGHGLTAYVRSGPTIYFGDASRPVAKWMAVSAVLADAGSAGAAYIDVSDPVRPVAGGGSAASGASGTSGSISSSGSGATGATASSGSGATGSSGSSTYSTATSTDTTSTP
jgi:cell division protein FtsQ